MQRTNSTFRVPTMSVVSPWEVLEVGQSFFTPVKQPQTQDEVDDLIGKGYLFSPADGLNNAFFYMFDDCVRTEE